jgi:glyoxylase-like metal-dependent hydrolase (beta-lactamase superfamily II)
MSAVITAFFHKGSSTFSYVLADSASRHCAVVDPALDYDAAAGRTSTVLADAIIAHVQKEKLVLDWILETHAHADHVSAAQHIKRVLGGKVAIGDGIRRVQASFAKLFNIESQVASDGSQFDRLFEDGESFRIGSLDARAMATPGHTSDSLTYVVGNAAFVGDTLFMPDSGTARCDFPGGDAGRLYDSIRRIFSLPDDTRLYMCHDYAQGGREYLHQTTVAEQKHANIHVREGVSREQFIALRTARDKSLQVPALLLPAVQINIRAGNLPTPEANGVSYLKIPLNKL